MKPYNTSSYPVFEADQVLSQKDLNMAVSHLEEQDRITRKNLVGIGISCGMNLDFSTQNQVKISCGTAITSLGFQINWDEQLFTFYKKGKFADQFLFPDYTTEPYLDNIFKYRQKYSTLKNFYELVPNGSSDAEKTPIPNNFFDDKIIVLVLELTLNDLKNCVTTNCDDKGKRLDFNVKPIAIPISEIGNETFQKFPSFQYNSLRFPRYNVPAKAITNATQVLEGFSTPLDKAYLQEISKAISEIYNDYKNNLSSNFSIFNDAISIFEKTIRENRNTLNTQYVWDWVSDIVATYNEIICTDLRTFSLCCVDESLFPFHVVLGGKTDELFKYRTPFFETGNLSGKHKNKMLEIEILFEKLLHILLNFKILKKLDIKITPSKYGNFPLSKKAIPYYYSDVLDLKKVWNPKISLKNKCGENLSYFSNLPNYTDKPEIKTPLLYETEPFNFFRIEGHIGKNYKEALQNILNIQQTHQLPFKVIALNAVQFKELSIKKIPDGTDWGYLETDYDLVRRNWENVVGKIIEWLELNQGVIRKMNYVKDKAFFDNYIKFLKKGRNSMVENFTDFIKIYLQFIPIYEKIEMLSLQFREAVYHIRETSDAKFDEDLIDHIDEVIMVCEKGEFRALYEAALEKWKNIVKNWSLQNFIEKHPGLEHKCGVTRGGTFVLVYKEQLQRLVLDRQLASNLKTFSRVAKTADATPAEKIPTEKSTTFSETDCNDIMQVSLEKMVNYINYNHPENSVEFVKYLHYYFNPNFNVLLRDEIPEQTVIADFFLPYICCSEGDNFSFVLENPVPQPQPQPGDFLNTDFDNTDFNTNT